MLILNPSIYIGEHAIPSCVEDIYFNGTKAQWEQTYGYYTVSSSTTLHFNEGSDAQEFETDGTVLVKYKGSGGAVTIPDSITKIGRAAFMWCDTVTSVIIPSSVTMIDGSAFMNCHSLTSITIPVSVTSIGSLAFENCTGLKDVYFDGTEAQWNKIEINNMEGGNRFLNAATKHFKDGGDTPAPSTGFTDVKSTDYFADAVKWAVENNITAGKGNNLFKPNDKCTRGEIVTFLWRSAGSPEPETAANSFSDVKEKDYYYKAVLWAVENDITAGKGVGTFKPGDKCTRAEAMTFMWRAAGEPAPNGASSFKDVVSGSFYEKAVGWAVEKGITAGKGTGTFKPNDKCSRAEIVSFLYRGRDL